MEHSNHAARKRQHELNESMKAFLNSGGTVTHCTFEDSAFYKKTSKRSKLMLSNEDKMTVQECEYIRKRLQECPQSGRSSTIKTLANKFVVSEKIIRQIDAGTFLPVVR